MFSFFKKALSKIYNHLTGALAGIFGKSSIDHETLTDLERILITADTGVRTTRAITDRLRAAWSAGTIKAGADLKQALKQELLAILEKKPYQPGAAIFLMVGINGSGKTTFTSKLAAHFHQQKKRVLLVAADTFRAAAQEQLHVWANKIGVDIIMGKPQEDPAAVVYQGCQRYIAGGYDILIIDTAGRLQTKINLMKELEKVKRSISKHLPDHRITTLLTVDAMLGQNSFDQAKMFNESTDLTGIVLTKMDGTGKGGIVFSIVDQLNVPVAYISYGESIDDMSLFNPADYVNSLIE